MKGLTKTAIPYLDLHWPIATGCLPDKPCWAHCWARAMAHRFHRDFAPTFHPGLLDAPLRSRAPAGTVVGVAFGGDLGLMTPTEIAVTLGACAMRPDLTFVMTTKRPESIANAMILIGRKEPGTIYARGRCKCVQDFFCAIDHPERIPPGNLNEPWPLPNVYLGFSAWDQSSFDAGWRAMAPLAAAGWHVWASIEPMIGAVDVLGAVAPRASSIRDAVMLARGGPSPGSLGCPPEPGASEAFLKLMSRRLSGIILGGESGPGARPMHPDWARAVRDQCAAAGGPFYFKQWGEWFPTWGGGDHLVYRDGHVIAADHEHPDAWKLALAEPVLRVGCKAAGNVLDGRTWTETPWGRE